MNEKTDMHGGLNSIVTIRKGRLIVSLWLLISVGLSTFTIWWVLFRDQPIVPGEPTNWLAVLDVCKAGECKTKGFPDGMQMHFPYDYTRSSHHLTSYLTMNGTPSSYDLDVKSSNKYYWLDEEMLHRISMSFVVFDAEFTNTPIPYSTANATERGHYAWTKNSKWNREWAQFQSWDGNRAHLTISKRVGYSSQKDTFFNRRHWGDINNSRLKSHKMKLKAERIMGLLWYQRHGTPTPGHLEMFVDDKQKPQQLIYCQHPTSTADIKAHCNLRAVINDDLEIELTFPRPLLLKWRQLERSIQVWLRSYLTNNPDEFRPEPPLSQRRYKFNQ